MNNLTKVVLTGKNKKQKTKNTEIVAQPFIY